MCDWGLSIYLTPLIPLSFEGEGEIKKRGFTPLRYPLKMVQKYTMNSKVLG
jgi:hypothetical protein